MYQFYLRVEKFRGEAFMEKFVRVLKLCLSAGTLYFFLSFNKRTIFYSPRPEDWQVLFYGIPLLILSIGVGLYYVFVGKGLLSGNNKREALGQTIIIGIWVYALNGNVDSFLSGVIITLLIAVTIYHVFDLVKRREVVSGKLKK